MKVSEFIEWLKLRDQDATVEIVSAIYTAEGTGHFEVGFKEFKAKIDEDFDYLDLRGNPFTRKDSPHYNQRYLRLGIHE